MINKKDFLVFIFILFLLLFYSFFAQITADEGIPLNGSIILLHGKDIYKDLVKVEGPFTFLVNLPILYFFPKNLLFPRLLTGFLIGISLLILFVMSKEILDDFFPYIFIFLFIISLLIIQYIVPSHRCYSFVLGVFSIFFVYLFIKYKKYYYLFLSGFFTGLNLLTMINNGFFCFLSLFLFFLIKYRSNFFEIFFKFLYGFLFPVLMFFLYAFLRGILDDYFYNIYIYIIKGNYIKAQLWYNNFWSFYFNTFKDFFYGILGFKINLIYRNFIKIIVNSLPLIIYFISFIYLKREKSYYFLLIFISGLFQFISVLIQGPDASRWLFSLGISFLLLVYFLQKIYKTRRKVGYIFLPFLLYFPLKFITHTEFVIKDKEFYSDKRFLVFVSKEEKRGFEELKNFLNENTVGRGDVFFLDNGTIFYFLYNKEIPVKYDVILPYLLPFEEEVEVCENLRKKKVKYFINITGKPNPGIKHWKKNYIYNFVIKNYEKIKEINFGGEIVAEIYRLKGI